MREKKLTIAAGAISTAELHRPEGKSLVGFLGARSSYNTKASINTQYFGPLKEKLVDPYALYLLKNVTQANFLTSIFLKPLIYI